MPRGDKSSYTDKQKRQAEHIEEGYEDRGVPEKEAERRAWATVNKETHGGKKSGSGRGTPEDHSAPEREDIWAAPHQPAVRRQNDRDPPKKRLRRERGARVEQMVRQVGRG
jgi:hypothetical protein